MPVALWLFALYMVVIGIVALVSPEPIRRMSRWFMTPMRIRVSTVLSIALGLAIFAGRLQTGHPMFVGVLGLLVAVSSIMYLFLPWRIQQRINEWSVNLSDGWFRIFGVLYLLIGAGMIFALVGR